MIIPSNHLRGAGTAEAEYMCQQMAEHWSRAAQAETDHGQDRSERDASSLLLQVLLLIVLASIAAWVVHALWGYATVGRYHLYPR